MISLPNDRLLKQAFLMSKDNYRSKKSNFASTIYSILDKYQLLYIWRNENAIFNLDGKQNNNATNILAHKKFWKSYVRKLSTNLKKEIG